MLNKSWALPYSQEQLSWEEESMLLVPGIVLCPALLQQAMAYWTGLWTFRAGLPTLAAVSPVNYLCKPPRRHTQRSVLLTSPGSEEVREAAALGMEAESDLWKAPMLQPHGCLTPHPRSQKHNLT